MIGIRREIFFGFGKLVVKGLISGLDLKGSLSGLGINGGHSAKSKTAARIGKKNFLLDLVVTVRECGQPKKRRALPRSAERARISIFMASNLGSYAPACHASERKRQGGDDADAKLGKTIFPAIVR